MNVQRTNRDSESRAVESRAAEGRQIAERPRSWVPPQYLPSPDPRPGWTHRWIRTSMIGQSDPNNLSSKLREGFEPCKAEDYPELSVPATADGSFKGNIELGGLMLCRVPEEFMKQRANYYANLNKAQMDAVDNNFMRENNPKMPLFKESSSRVSFGSGK